MHDVMPGLHAPILCATSCPDVSQLTHFLASTSGLVMAFFFEFEKCFVCYDALHPSLL